MTEASLALTLSVGILAVFGVVMVGINQFARQGALWARPWVEERAPVVYTMILAAAAVLFVAFGRLDLFSAVSTSSVPMAVVAFAAAPFIAATWYLTELTVSSWQVRPAGLLGSGGASEPSEVRETVAGLVGDVRLWWVLAAASAVLEEFIFRGMLQSAMAAEFGVWVAVLVGALVFGLHHVVFGVPSVVSKTVGGALMGWQTILCGSVLPAVVTHLCFQALVFRRLRRLEGRNHAG